MPTFNNPHRLGTSNPGTTRGDIQEQTSSTELPRNAPSRRGRDEPSRRREPRPEEEFGAFSVEGQQDVVAHDVGSDATFVAGPGISLTTSPSGRSITIGLSTGKETPTRLVDLDDVSGSFSQIGDTLVKGPDGTWVPSGFPGPDNDDPEPSAPVEPNFPIPVEGDCDIVVDAQTFEISFPTGLSTAITQASSWDGLGLAGYSVGDLTTMAAGSGNPVGSDQGQINLVAQAINMAVRDKAYEPSGDQVADRLGRIVVGIKNGNGGSLRVSKGTPNSFPATRVSENRTDVWDNARSSSPPITPPSGLDVSMFGFDIAIVGLTADAQLQIYDIGPAQGDIFPDGYAEQTVGVEFYSLGVRVAPGLSAASYVNFHYMPDERFVMIDCDFLPLDPAADGVSYTTLDNGVDEYTCDAKWGVIQGNNAGGCALTYLKNNGTSGLYPSTAMAQSYGAAPSNVVFSEHVYYLKGGGDVWYVGHGAGSMTPIHTCRSFSQIRPEATYPNDVARNGTVVWKGNIIPGHGSGVIDSAGAIPSGQYGVGAGVMTVWSNQGDTWFIDNQVTNAYFAACVVVDQQVGRNIPDDDTWAINRVYFSGNTLSNDAAALMTTRPTLTVSACQEVHFLAGNVITAGNFDCARVNQEPLLSSSGGTDRDIGVVYSYPSVNLNTSFIGAVKCWDRGTSGYLTLDKNAPTGAVPEWVVLTDVEPALVSNVDTNGYLVGGRDVPTDGAKLDGIESGATGDQTGAEIKAAYEGEADTNAFTDSEKTKLAGVAAGADVSPVSSVFGRTGAVVAGSSDYDSDDIGNQSTAVGASVTAALDYLIGVISGLGSDDVGNDTAVPASATVTEAVDVLYTQMVANVIQISANVTAIANNVAALNSGALTLITHTGQIATLETDVVAADQWIMPIWAEENSALGASNTYEWAFGNGADMPNTNGVVVYVPAGYSAEIAAMGLSIGAGTATVEAVINGTPQGSTADVTVSTGRDNINTLGSPPSVSNGDVLNFRTTSSSGTAAPCVATMFVRVFQTP